MKSSYQINCFPFTFHQKLSVSTRKRPICIYIFDSFLPFITFIIFQVQLGYILHTHHKIKSFGDADCRALAKIQIDHYVPQNIDRAGKYVYWDQSRCKYILCVQTIGSELHWQTSGDNILAVQNFFFPRQYRWLA